MTIDQERVHTSKFNIRQALKSVGVDVPVTKRLDEYPPYIVSGGGSTQQLSEVTITVNWKDLTFYGVFYDEELNRFNGEVSIKSDGQPHTVKIATDTKICVNEDLYGFASVTATGDVSYLDVTAPPMKNVFAIGGDGTIAIINEVPPQQRGNT